MDIKKDWNKLAIAVITGILGIIFALSIFVDLADTGGTGLDVLDLPAEFGAGFPTFALMYLIPTLFFLGVCAYTVMKLLNVDIAKYVILGVGAVNLILFFIAMITAPEFPGLEQFDLMMVWAPLALFALFPLIKGVKKCFFCEKAA